MRHLFMSRCAIVCLLLSLQDPIFSSAALAKDTQTQEAGAASAQVVEPIVISAQMSASDGSIIAIIADASGAPSTTSSAAFPLRKFYEHSNSVSMYTPDFRSNSLKLVSTCSECHLLSMEVQLLSTEMVNLPTQQTVLITLQ